MLDKIKNSKITSRFISVVFAVAIWLALTYTVNPTITQTVKNVAISYTGENELIARGLVEDGKSRTQSVDVKIRGSRSAVINAMATISAEVDLSDITSTGEKLKTVSIDTGTSGVTLVGRNRPKVSVNIEELVEKQIPVRITQTGVEKNKRKLAGTESAEKSLRIRGAKSEVSQVAAATASVDISQIEGELTQRAALTFVNADGAKISPSTLIEAPDKIEVTTKLYERATVPVKVTLSEEDRAVYAMTVKSVSKEKIDIGIADGADAPEEVYAVFAPEKFREGQEEYTLRVNVPEGVYISPENENITVKLNLEKTVERLINFSVNVKNVAAGLKAQCSVQNITLKARGAADELVSGRSVYADAANLGEGAFELPLSTGEDSGIELLEKTYVTVNITQ